MALLFVLFGAAKKWHWTHPDILSFVGRAFVCIAVAAVTLDYTTHPLSSTFSSSFSMGFGSLPSIGRLTLDPTTRLTTITALIASFSPQVGYGTVCHNVSFVPPRMTCCSWKSDLQSGDAVCLEPVELTSLNQLCDILIACSIMLTCANVLLLLFMVSYRMEWNLLWNRKFGTFLLFPFVAGFLCILAAFILVQCWPLLLDNCTSEVGTELANHLQVPGAMTVDDVQITLTGTFSNVVLLLNVVAGFVLAVIVDLSIAAWRIAKGRSYRQSHQEVLQAILSQATAATTRSSTQILPEELTRSGSGTAGGEPQSPPFMPDQEVGSFNGKQ